MRSIWINEGDELNVDRVRAFGIERVFWSERSHTPDHIRYARSQGFSVGIYSDPIWYGYPPPQTYRDDLNHAVTRMLGDNAQLAVMVDYERHDAAWIIDFFYWWRRVRPARETYWTLEGFQGGWAYRAMRSAQLSYTNFVPQCYDDKMRPYDSAGVVKDLVDWGVDTDRVLPFIDAVEADRRGWYGFAYMQHRLP